jgi:hypothetical protein
MSNERPLLNVPEIFPSDEVLKNVFGESFTVYEELLKKLTDDFGIIFNWHYYNDGKSWLCKVAHKKKTIFWLSAWDGYFRTTFFFLERHLEGIIALGIDDSRFKIEKTVGKLIPLIFSISKSEQLQDLIKMIVYKKGLK